jgi:hypothetical protein
MGTSNLWQPALMTAYGPTKSSQEIVDSFWRTVSVRASLAQLKKTLDDGDKFYLAVAAGVPFKTETIHHEDGSRVFLRMTTAKCNFVRDPERGWVCYYQDELLT